MAGSLLHAEEEAVSETPGDNHHKLSDEDVLPLGEYEKPGQESCKLGDVDENGFIHLKDGITSDTGAADHVGPPDAFPGYPLKESQGSKRGVHYIGAGGARFPNLGQKTVLIMTKEKRFKWITVQMANVRKVPGSVSKNNDNGVDAYYSKVHGAYLENVKNKERTSLRRQRGVFVLDTWVVPYAMAKSGTVAYKDENGRPKVAKVNVSTTEGFSRPE